METMEGLLAGGGLRNIHGRCLGALGLRVLVAWWMRMKGRNEDKKGKKRKRNKCRTGSIMSRLI
jgi:hypothetical protein